MRPMWNQQTRPRSTLSKWATVATCLLLSTWTTHHAWALSGVGSQPGALGRDRRRLRSGSCLLLRFSPGGFFMQKTLGGTPTRPVAVLIMTLLAMLGIQIIVPQAAMALTVGWWSGDAPVTQEYGCTTFSGEPRDSRCPPSAPYFHAGLDIGLNCGTPLYAARAGTVVSIGGESYYGNYYPRIRMDDGHDVILAHVQPPVVVSVGQRIDVGQLVAYVGTQGNSTGC